MKIGVFFGSFNPIHKGHIAIAELFLKEAALDQVWLSVSPHNPLKAKDSLLATTHRVAMANIAVQNYANIKVTDFEKELPQPSYTYEALCYLKNNCPQNDYVLLIGGDNCMLFDQWRNYDKILREFPVWAYPRRKAEMDAPWAQEMHIIDAPLLNYASTAIRQALKARTVVKGLQDDVLAYIRQFHLYEE